MPPFGAGREVAEMTPRMRGSRCTSQRSSRGGLVFTCAATQAGCKRAASQQRSLFLKLTSSGFSGDPILDKYSRCKGRDDISPELSWSAPPERTQSFALMVFDNDSPFGFKFTHWVLYDIPSDKRELPENTAKQEQLPDGSCQGHNDCDRMGYVGPCPPRGTHHYVFTLYALDTKQN